MRGNQPYFFYSYRSGGPFKNYTLMVTNPRSGNTGISWDDPDGKDLQGNPSPNDFGNPSFHESPARFYYGQPDHLPNPNTDVLSGNVVADDDPQTGGKNLVEFHRGNVAAANTGSGGCLVSPSHIDLRNDLIGRYLDDYKDFYGVNDQDTDPYLGGPGVPPGLKQLVTYPSSQNRWNNENAADGGQAGQRDYNKKLTGILWLIRPDEPPIGNPTR